MFPRSTSGAPSTSGSPAPRATPRSTNSPPRPPAASPPRPPPRPGSPPPPAEAAQLLDPVRIRVAARALGVEKVEAGGGTALVTFSPATPLDPERLVRAIHASRGRLRMKREFTVEAAVARGAWPAVRDSLLRLLAELARA